MRLEGPGRDLSVPNWQMVLTGHWLAYYNAIQSRGLPDHPAVPIVERAGTKSWLMGLLHRG